MQSGLSSALASSPSCHTLLQPSATAASQLMPSLFRLWGWFLVGLKPKPFLIVSLLRQHNVDASPLARKKHKTLLFPFSSKFCKVSKQYWVQSNNKTGGRCLAFLMGGSKMRQFLQAPVRNLNVGKGLCRFFFVLLLSLELYFTICCHRMSRTTPLFSSHLAPLVEWQARCSQV